MISTIDVDSAWTADADVVLAVRGIRMRMEDVDGGGMELVVRRERKGRETEMRT